MSKKEPARIDIRSVQQLLSPSDEPEPAWLIENLIREGDQVVLAGAPKSGKSFFAFQLAMAVAQGRNHINEGWFLLPDFTLPLGMIRKVLFFSLEMGPGVVRSRLRPWKALSPHADASVVLGFRRHASENLAGELGETAAMEREGRCARHPLPGILRFARGRIRSASGTRSVAGRVTRRDWRDTERGKSSSR